jgi:pimeloyl-ACP methyl ester carboxylesterase
MNYSRLVVGFLLDLSMMPMSILMFLLQGFFHIMLDIDLNSFWPKQSENLLILVHGSGSSEFQFLPARFMLQNDKFQVHSVQLCGLITDPEDTIEDYVQELENQLDGVITENTKNIVMVGYSMGGLIAAEYILTRSDSNKYKLVTINTPWNGAPLLSLLPMRYLSQRHKQMIPNSIYLTNLTNNLSSRNFPIHCYGAKYDFQVPEPYCYLKSCNSTQLFTGSHNSLTINPQLWAKITTVLDNH